jgi:hypothetical protein
MCVLSVRTQTQSYRYTLLDSLNILLNQQNIFVCCHRPTFSELENMQTPLDGKEKAIKNIIELVFHVFIEI